MSHRPGVTCPAYVWAYLSWEHAEALVRHLRDHVSGKSRSRLAKAMAEIERSMKEADACWETVRERNGAAKEK